MDIEKQNQPMGQPMGQPIRQPMGHHEGQQAWTVVRTAVPLGPKPVNLTCPHCAQKVTSVIETETQSQAYLKASILCLLG